METMHVKLVFKSYAVYVNGKEKLRTGSQKTASAYYIFSIPYFFNRDYKEKIRIATETAIADCEVIRYRYQNNSRYGKRAGKTHYRVYVNGEFVKELSFKPKPMALINAIAPGLDWKKIED